MYIDEEGYLCDTIDTEWTDDFKNWHTKEVKYKVNKEGLFEEVK